MRGWSILPSSMVRTSTNGSAVLAGSLADGSWDMEIDRPGEVSELDVRYNEQSSGREARLC